MNPESKALQLGITKEFEMPASNLMGETDLSSSEAEIGPVARFQVFT